MLKANIDELGHHLETIDLRYLKLYESETHGGFKDEYQRNTTVNTRITELVNRFKTLTNLIKYE